MCLQPNITQVVFSNRDCQTGSKYSGSNKLSPNELTNMLLLLSESASISFQLLLQLRANAVCLDGGIHQTPPPINTLCTVHHHHTWGGKWRNKSRWIDNECFRQQVSHWSRVDQWSTDKRVDILAMRESLNHQVHLASVKYGDQCLSASLLSLYVLILSIITSCSLSLLPLFSGILCASSSLRSVPSPPQVE